MKYGVVKDLEARGGKKQTNIPSHGHSKPQD